MESTQKTEQTMDEAFTDLDISTSDEGFYEGYNKSMSIISKVIMAALVIWAAFWPGNAERLLAAFNGQLLDKFNSLYVVSAGLFFTFLLVIAIIPYTGKRKLGIGDEKPEFSTFSWFAMMFGAGLGVGLMVYSTAEPLGLWGSNPEIIRGSVEANSQAALGSAYRWTFLHYGFHAWAIYVTVGLSLSYYAYRRAMPLTIRTALTPLFGKHINGVIGNFIDVLAVIATILGIAVTVGFGVSQLVDGVYSILPMQWLMQSTDDGGLSPSIAGLLAALILIMSLSIISAVSGVGRGIKYLSNLNLVLSCILLVAFIFFGSFLFSMKMYGLGLKEYFASFINLSFVSYPTDTDVGAWQSGWTTFYWAWWIAFAPFVGLFLARISRGRTIREFVVGAVLAPSLVCFLWMTVLGGTSIDLELSGIAGGKIIEASSTAKLFETMSFMFDGSVLYGLTVMCVILILTFLITSADSGVLVLNTIVAGGNVDTDIKHRIIWGVVMTAVIGTLLLAGGGGFGALQNAMIIGALPFCFVMILMCVSLGKALIRDNQREKQGVITQYPMAVKNA